MSDISIAVEALRRFQVMFKGLAEVADTLEQLGSLDGQAEALRKQAADAVAQRDAALADADASARFLERTHDTATQVLGVAQDEAAEIRRKAEQDYAAMIELAKADAVIERNKILDGKKAEIRRLDQAVKDAMETRDLVSVQVRDLGLKRAALDQEIHEREAKLAQVRAAIAALKE